MSKRLTERQYQILERLYKSAKTTKVYSVSKSQAEIAQELKISRQALSIHLRKLKVAKYVRTGRGFVDITQDGITALGKSTVEAFVHVKVSPQGRSAAYKVAEESGANEIYRVTGDSDLIAIVEYNYLDSFLKKVSGVEGVTETKAFVIIEKIK
ncbi:MAG: Lrp/AsnC family transcriptional regulator [Thermoprotei archaeon]